MPNLAHIGQLVDDISSAVAIGGRTLLSLDTNPVPNEWDHITKVDPEDEKRLPLCYPLYLQHTSAIEVGGSKDVTGDNTEETLELVADRPAPAFQEPSGPRHVTDKTREQAEFLAIPEVLNGDAEAIVGQLGEGIEYMKEELAPQMLAEKLPISPGAGIEDRLTDFVASWMIREAVFEAYIIMNLDSAAAREGNVTEDDLLSPTQAKQRAMAAERHHETEIVYLEYSGTFGDDEAEELLESISGGLTWSRLWYGGGLDDRENARKVSEAGADAVVVGNVFHEIAEEELEICREAVDDLDHDASRDEVAGWIAEEVDVADSCAASYLSTILEVSNPDGRAREYLLTTIRSWLALQSVIEDLDESEPSTTAEIRAAVADADIPGKTEVRDALGGEDFLTDVLVGLLANRYDLDADLPVGHVVFDPD